MKRKTIALMTALVFSVSLSACENKTSISANTTDTTNVEETDEIPEEAETPKEETIPEETEEDIAQKEIEKVQSALGEMPYYGDTANCKMTAEQATAYAQLIADGLAGDFSFRDGYDKWYDVTSWNDTLRVYLSRFSDSYFEVDRFNVMLGDFSYDGIPYLYVYSSDISKNNDLQSFEIYGWKNDIAELVCDTHSSGSSIAWETYDLYEDENDQIKLLFNTSFGVGEGCIIYSFSEGAMDESYSQQAFWDGDVVQIKENGIETEVCTNEEYYPSHAVLKDVQEFRENHTHTQPYTCFYDMTPCTLEEMVNYLNAYASAMSDGQSVPVEIIEAKESIESSEPTINQEGFLIAILQRQQEEIEKTKDMFPAYNPMEHMGELTIINNNQQTSDDNLSYSIDGNNIIYNGTTYTDLYINAKELEADCPYDADTIIKCLLQGYPSNDTIYTMCNMTSENSEMEYTEGVDYNDMPVDEEFAESSELYKDLCNKYNDSAKWELTIYKYGMTDRVSLVGCKSFILITGTDEEIIVDVTNF